MSTYHLPPSVTFVTAQNLNMLFSTKCLICFYRWEPLYTVKYRHGISVPKQVNTLQSCVQHSVPHGKCYAVDL